MRTTEVDDALRALAHAGRRRVIGLVAEQERTSGELARRCRMTKPAMSQHLAVLRDAGLVRVRAEGNRRYYRADTTRLTSVRNELDAFWAARLAALKRAVEDEA